MAQNKIGLLERLDIAVNRESFKTVNLKRNAGVDLLWACKKILPNYYKNLSPESRKFIASKKPDVFDIGGWGSGKTYDLCAKTVISIWLNAPQPWLFLAQTKSNSEATTEASLKKLLKAEKISYRSFDREGYTIYELDFGDGVVGTMELTSGHSEVAIAGPTYAGVSIDECFLVKKKVVLVALARARDPEAILNQALFASTIERGRMDWGFNIVDNNFKGDEFTDKVVKDTRKQKHVTKEFIARMERWLDSRMQMVYLGGEDVNLSGDLAYYMFNRSRNTKELTALEIHNKIVAAEKIVLCLDFNVGYMCAGIQITEGKVTAQLKEFFVPNSNTAELADSIAEWWMENYPKKYLIVTGDASGRAQKSSSRGMNDYQQIKEIFKSYGVQFTINVPASNPFVFPRTVYINNLFEKELFYIATSCKESIIDRETVVWKTGLEAMSFDKKDPKRTHLSDANDYGAYTRKSMGIDSKMQDVPYRNRITAGPARRSYGV